MAVFAQVLDEVTLGVPEAEADDPVRALGLVEGSRSNRIEKQNLFAVEVDDGALVAREAEGPTICVANTADGSIEDVMGDRRRADIAAGSVASGAVGHRTLYGIGGDATAPLAAGPSAGPEPILTMFA